MNADQIIDQIAREPFWFKRYELMIPNCYYDGEIEADLLALKPSGFVDEFEVKVSRSDYFADFKKSYSLRPLKLDEYALLDGVAKKDYPNTKLKHEGLKEGFLSNYFWFVLPAGLVEESEVPNHCGIVEIQSLKRGGFRSRILRNAPRLNKQKIDLEKRYQLARKSNFRFWDYRLGRVNSFAGGVAGERIK